MPSEQITFGRVTESFNDLVRRVADRDQAAFGRLYRRLVHRIFIQVREGLGDTASAVPVTRAVFVEVWRLAPTSAARHDDALAWLTAIASRRVVDRLRAVNHQPPPLVTNYDDHIRQELAAILDTHPHTTSTRLNASTYERHARLTIAAPLDRTTRSRRPQPAITAGKTRT
jgi:DNA-directed RNA polymerase specialized sigma24 family protein